MCLTVQPRETEETASEPQPKASFVAFNLEPTGRSLRMTSMQCVRRDVILHDTNRNLNEKMRVRHSGEGAPRTTPSRGGTQTPPRFGCVRCGRDDWGKLIIAFIPAGFRGGRIRPEGRAGAGRVCPESRKGRGRWRGIRGVPRVARERVKNLPHPRGGRMQQLCNKFALDFRPSPPGRLRDRAARGES